MSLSPEFELRRNQQKRPDQLCDRCQRFTTGIFANENSRHLHPSRVLRHYSSFQEIEDGAEADCHICSILLAGIDVSSYKSSQPSIYAHITTSLALYSGFSVRWFIGSSEDGLQRANDAAHHVYKASLHFIFNVERSDDSEIHWCESNSERPDGSKMQWYESNASDEALQWIRDWISPHKEVLRPSRALLSHDISGKSLKEKVEFLANRLTRTRSLETLPVRVLDIGTSIGASSVKLAPGDTLLNNDYVALSYTWGADHPAMLTKNRLTDWERAIPANNLPKSFTDAIWITRRLKIQYLWIDAFCILQNDDAEWASESVKMGYIFQNSLLTLAASDAENSNSGLLSLREPLAYNSCILSSPSGDKFELVLNCTSSELKRPILDQRGWVYQERLLANRTAHFSRTRIRLEDSYQLRCETHLHCERPCKVIDPFWARKTHFRSHNPAGFGSDWRSEDALRCWSRLVSDYSETKLTRPSDKLPAIAGLISYAQTNGKPHYSFGHWIQLMPQELLWRAGHPGVAVSGRAPSWSWASIDGARVHNDFGLSYKQQTRFDYSEMVRYPAKTSPFHWSHGSAYDESHAVEIKAHILEGAIESSGKGDGRFMLRFCCDTEEALVHFYPDSATKCSNDTSLFCALMSSGNREPDSLMKVECLVVARATAEKVLVKAPICFNRVGYAVQHGDHACRNIIRLFRGAPPKDMRIL